MFYPIEKSFSRITDKLITITGEDYQLACRKFYCNVERIHGVGVDGNRYHPVSREMQMNIRKRFGFSDEQKIILCVGELLPNKNQQMAIQAMAEIVKKYPDAQMLLAGNGPEKDKLENLIQTMNLDNNVKMLGYVTNLQEYQKIADVSVSCSKREGLPLNIVEAMLSGTPVVASINRGHRELICDGKTGFLVHVNDENSMAKHILILFNDIKGYKDMSKLEQKYGQKYSFNSVKKELENIYFYDLEWRNQHDKS